MSYFFHAVQKAVGLEAEQTAEPITADRKPESLDTAASVAATAPVTPKPVHVYHPEGRDLPRLVAFPQGEMLEVNIVAVEQCRVLRSRLLELIRVRKLKSILITSTIPGAGKTVISCNLAFAMSQLNDFRVLLVDADLRRPSVARFFGMDFKQGFEEVLEGKANWRDLIFAARPNLHILPARSLDLRSTDLLDSEVSASFIAEVEENYDLVVFDGTPLFPVSDAHVLSSRVDGTVLVLRAHTTPSELAKQAMGLLGKRMVATILNCGDSHGKKAYYKSYYGSSRNPTKQ